MEIVTYHSGVLKGLARAMDLEGQVVLFGDWFPATLDEEGSQSCQLRVQGIVHIIRNVYRYLRAAILVTLIYKCLVVTMNEGMLIRNVATQIVKSARRRMKIMLNRFNTVQ